MFDPLGAISGELNRGWLLLKRYFDLNEKDDMNNETLSLLKRVQAKAKAPAVKSKRGRLKFKFPRKAVYLSALVISLFFLDFPNDARSRADLVVTNRTLIEIRETADGITDAFKFDVAIERHRLGAELSEDHFEPLYLVSFSHQGRTYFETTVGVSLDEFSGVVYFKDPPIVVGSTRVTFSHLNSFESALRQVTGANQLYWEQSVPTSFSLAGSDGASVPLSQFIDTSIGGGGYLIVETRPAIGWERFKSNIGKFWGLIS